MTDTEQELCPECGLNHTPFEPVKRDNPPPLTFKSRRSPEQERVEPLTRVECITVANTARIHIDKLFAQTDNLRATIAELRERDGALFAAIGSAMPTMTVGLGNIPRLIGMLAAERDTLRADLAEAVGLVREYSEHHVEADCVCDTCLDARAFLAKIKGDDKK